MCDSRPQSNKIGLFGATAYVISSVIGSGIFVTPTVILRRTNSIGLSLIVWAVCGVISALGAFVYLELGTSIRESGSDFAYVCYVKWYPVAFAFMWVRRLSRITYRVARKHSVF
jgi:amino acid transporter